MWESGRLTDSTYWELAPQGRAATASSHLTDNASARKALEEDVYATLDQAVSMQTVSDVPVGLFLSGGIDSSSLAGILSRAGIRLNTFSIVFREAEYNESEYSRAVARAFSSEHQAIMVSQRDVLDAIPYALRAMDQPTIDGLNTFLIARQTRAAGIKVALSAWNASSDSGVVFRPPCGSRCCACFLRCRRTPTKTGNSPRSATRRAGYFIPTFLRALCLPPNSVILC